ncbi:ABC transporter permease [Demequina capsici]|uniref:ABC transporter permease n=1 Tax=Demequina capsici TaxID=3075620 RepID=A0AA96JCB3_9MICO|nr:MULTISPECIES: ABC transporter permease [unclassified Demequina]WNM26029.1 ABC transporter permease [Demequina sp. OYTSA14]WNM28903.1 ABC transporter permease [Demequina sp. PMTSA13]
MLREITESSWLVVLLAVVASLVIGAILIIFADPDVDAAAKYFFARPMDTISAAWNAVFSAYDAMFRGSVWNYTADSFSQQLRPLTETLTIATPLIFAGLGLGMGFRAGLFNIGAQGQIIMGAMLGGWVGFAWHLPAGLHLLVAVLATILGGALWGFIPGLLKAKTGAHEVIVTIMLNYVAANLLAYALSTDAFQRPGSDNPQSPIIDTTAQYPLILGSSYRLHLGFLLAIAAAFGVWWLMERSTWGFRFRAVGANPRAARTAGMNVSFGIIAVMTIAGALAGLAGSAQILGTEKTLTAGIAGSFGFDAITVALLGRSRPFGTVLAGLLFGAFRASGPTLQVAAGLPVDIVLILQSLIVLFIAAPPLVRFLFRLPTPTNEKVVTA